MEKQKEMKGKPQENNEKTNGKTKGKPQEHLRKTAEKQDK